MLEVHLILDHFGTYRQHRICRTHLNGGLFDNSMDTGLTTTELEYIATVIAMDDAHRYTKRVLLLLKGIKERITGITDRECFCSQVRRKIWYKEFISWYESIS